MGRGASAKAALAADVAGSDVPPADGAGPRPPAIPAQRRRPTQAERSSHSREKIIGAAITCLGTFGYAATSVHLIARTAEITTGRLQHQFATKADVMAEVIRQIQRENIISVALSGLTATEPADRLKEYLRHLAAVFDRADVVAIYEIRLALKGDAELDRVVGALLRDADETSFREMEALIVAMGASPDDAGMWRRLILAALRGSALERVARYGSGRVPVLLPLERIVDMLAADESLRAGSAAPTD